MNVKKRVLISPEKIQERVQEIAAQIERDYASKDLVIVALMKGAICIVADLIRHIDLPFTLEAIQCSSYGANGSVRGSLTIHGLDRINIHNRDVLIVDDIFDSGHTMQGVYDAIQSLQPRSVKSCVLLQKNISRSIELIPNYVLFEIEDLFVVGYGLDYKELYRGLPGICVLELE